MPSLSIDQLKANLSNPGLGFLFDLQISRIPGGAGDPETILLRCQSSEMPGKKFGVIEIPYKQGPKIQFPGKLEYDHDFTCTFIEGEDGTIFDTFNEWMNATIDDQTNEGGDSADYKTEIYLSMVTRSDNSTYRQFRLEGAYVSNIQKVPVSYNDDKSIVITVTFRFDKWSLVV